MGINKKLKQFSFAPSVLIIGLLVWGFLNYVNTKSPDSAGNLAGEEAIAGVADNVSGWAWSENIGWISFNCANDHDEDVSGVQDCVSMGGEDYGVNVREDMFLEGYAWSENIGWVGFNNAEVSAPIFTPAPASFGLDDMISGGAFTGSADVYYKVEIDGAGTPDTFKWAEWSTASQDYVFQVTGVPITGSAQSLSNGATITFGATTGHISGDYWTFGSSGPPLGKYDYSQDDFIAKYDEQSNELRGWARAVAALDDPADGWDGWIKLQKHPSDSGEDYGVIYDPATKKFSDFAWGSDVIGWTSFNSSNCDPDGDGITEGGAFNPAFPNCPNGSTTVAYAVIANINRPPSASQLSVAEGDYCDIPSHSFSWTFSDPDAGDSQSAYQLQVDDDPLFSSPAFDSCTLPTSTCDGSQATSYIVLVAAIPGVNQLAYNTSYHWRVKVFDTGGADSGWVSPNLSQSPFNTEPHLYPDSDFTVNPSAPSQGEEITLKEASTCYDINNNSVSCPAVAGNYKWDFDYETPPFTQDATGQTTKTTYSDTAIHTVALDVTDQDNNTCRSSKDVRPKRALPKFRETAPK